VRLLAFVLIASCFTLSLKAEELIKDKSPDEKFALRITNGEEGWEAAIIEVETKKNVLVLEAEGTYVRDAKVIWSRGSKRVACFSPNRSGGITTIYFRNDSKFEEIPLPELPNCSKPKGKENYLKTIEYSVFPERWLTSNRLVLTVYDEWETTDGASQERGENITIAFSAQNKASIQNATQKQR
jgi:hypothetical protein